MVEEVMSAISHMSLAGKVSMKWHIGGLSALIVVAVGLAGRVSAQSDAQGPSFEAASVKPGELDAGIANLSTPNGVRIVNQSLRYIIGLAYGIPLQFAHFRVQGGAERLMSAPFSIEATIPEGEKSTRELNEQRLQRLLAERFQVRTHWEKRPTPAYVIRGPRNGRLGPKIGPSGFDCPAWRKARVKIDDPDAPKDAKGQPWCEATMLDRRKPGVVVLRYAGLFRELINHLQGLLDKPVVDESGLTGLYEWELAFARDPERTPGTPSVFDAFEEQLGLKLESRTAPYEVLVVDAAQVPTPN